jgi:aspartyl-tRNA(Asn)/glutamyl-tRNA(Gln) amidotransferase subunit C
MVTDKDIEYVARLAKLKLSDEEKERLVSQMGDIVEFANNINKLNTDGVEPTNHILKVQNVFREDEVKESYSRDEILKNAPKKEAGCLVVPSVVQ